MSDFSRKEGWDITTIKLVVVDDHHLRRQSLVCLLKTCPSLDVVGEYSDVQELIKATNGVMPDVAIIDHTLPKISNSDPAGILHQWVPSLRVIILSDTLVPSHAITAIRSGADGFVVRFEDFDQLVQAIENVNMGRRFISPLVRDQILDEVVLGKSFDQGVDDRISAREREILQLVAEGKTNGEIGKLLVISTRTVETHRNNLMKKLGLSSQFDIMRYAIKQGLLSIE